MNVSAMIAGCGGYEDVIFPSLGSAMGGTSGGGNGSAGASSLEGGRVRHRMPGNGATTTFVMSKANVLGNGMGAELPGQQMQQPMPVVMGSVFPGNGAAGLGYGASPTEDIRTVFITGFPPDVRDRELHNLCCLLPGYEASQLSYKGGQPQGFALFVSAAHAMQAVEALVGLPFDVSGPSQPNSSQLHPLSAQASDLEFQMANLHVNHAAMANSGGAGAGGSTLVSPLASHAPNMTSVDGSGDPASSVTSEESSPHARSLGHRNSGVIQGCGVGDELRQRQQAAALHAAHFDRQQRSRMHALSSASSGVPPLVCKLRAEMAHKNMYIREGDPSIRRAHRPLLLLPNPGLGLNYAPAGTGYGVLSGLDELAAGGSMRNAGANAFNAGMPGLGNSGGGVHPLAAAAAGLQPSSSDNFSAQMQLGQGSGVAPGLERGMSNAGLMSAGSSNMAAALGTVGFMPVSNRGDNPPCNTLFIGNLSDQVSEMELMTLFSAQAGFRQMKLVRGPKQVSCFVEFEDVMSAAAVHATYQGAVLPSSERGGIRIQYSKNPFGRRQVMDMSTSSGTMGMGSGGSGQSNAFPGSAALDSFAPASYGTGNWPPQGLLQAGAGNSMQAGHQQQLYSGLMQQVQLHPMPAMYYNS